MYKLNVSASFSAAHHLAGYAGACRNLHGHNWKVRVCLLCTKTDDIGLTLDFKVVKELLNKLIDTVDHKYLNDLDFFKNTNPTSENIARYFYLAFKKELDGPDASVCEVEVWESENTSMVYFE